MKQRIIRTIMRPLLIVAVVLGLLKVAEAMAGNIDPSNNYAWATNVGWINFNSGDTDGVTVYPDHLEGYVWAENVGWIRRTRVAGHIRMGIHPIQIMASTAIAAPHSSQATRGAPMWAGSTSTRQTAA